MENYIWTWYDGDGVYTNKAASLCSIVEEVVEYYFDDDERNLIISSNEGNSTIEIKLTVNDVRTDYQVGAEGGRVARFLEGMARLVDRPDRFSIELI